MKNIRKAPPGFVAPARLDDLVSFLVLALIGVFVLIYTDGMNRLWRKMSFEVVESKIVRLMEGQAPVEFPLNQINFIGESRTGLIVRGGEPSKGFVIPRAVGGFEQLKRQLSDYHEIVPVTNTSSSFLIFPLILTIALYGLLLTARSRNLVLITGTIALLFQAWVIVGMRKTWAKTSSPRLLVSAFRIVLANSLVARIRAIFLNPLSAQLPVTPFIST